MEYKTPQSSMGETSYGTLSSPLDSKSLLLNAYLFRLTTPTRCFEMKRGPRFREYSDLREKRLKMRYFTGLTTPGRETDVNRSILTPPRKQMKFNSNMVTPPRRSKYPSSLTQSVPDFSSALRKENRKPAVTLPPVAEKSLTPPPKTVKFIGKAGKGSKSVNSEEKNGGFMIRKSYANMEEFKCLASTAVTAINGENKTRNGRGTTRTILGNY